MAAASPADVLDCWFGDHARRLWFERDAAFDELLRARFEPTLAAAARGELAAWADAADSCLALIVVLDQLPRNLYRESPRAFAYDPQVLPIAELAVARGFDRSVALDRRLFFYMPFEHSEDLAMQRRSVELFQHWTDDHHDGGEAEADAHDQLRYVRRHLEIIERFGRFPHRNAVLGRTSTPAEVAFLTEPMSSF